MGAWRFEIFSDDYACDVRDDYIELLYLHKVNDVALRKLYEAHLSDTDIEDEDIFWMALAATQWEHGRLYSDIKIKLLMLLIVVEI